MNRFFFILAVLQLVILLPLNLYLGLTESSVSFVFAGMNVLGGWICLNGIDPY